MLVVVSIVIMFVGVAEANSTCTVILGSTVVYPHDDPELEPMELGASIFVKVNKNLWRATEEFGLERYDFDDEDASLGVWDGSEFVLEVCCAIMFVGSILTLREQTGGSKWFYESWWDTLKVVWRYGYKAPMKTRSLCVYSSLY